MNESMSNSITLNDRQAANATQVIRQNSRSFSLAVRFLPARLRVPVTALYAWCRSVDDAVDQAQSAQAAEETLNLLEEDLKRCIAHQPIQHPASAWIQPLLAQRRIEVRHACELIDGMRMDLQPVCISTDVDLERYCYHAAGTVGLMMSRLMGVSDHRADRYAEALGMAMQLTNIARDVREDALLGRSYLPGVPQPLTSHPSRVKSAVMQLLDSAERYYCTAEQGLKYLPRDCRFGIRLALTFYREIGRQIRRNDYTVLYQRTTVSPMRLLLVAAQASLAFMKDEARIFLESNNSVTHLIKEWTMHAHNSNASSQEVASTKVSTSGQAKQLVYLGLSLTLIMATALFAMVFVHPKSIEYSALPLIYAGLCLCGSILFNRLSARCETA